MAGWGRWLLAALCAVAGMLWPAAAASGTPIWFDETDGGTGFGDFSAMATGYVSFMGTPEQSITFDDLQEGTKVQNQYRASHGVHMVHTHGGPNNSSSGVRTEGGAIAENITGYDGTYQSNGNKVYVKFDNDKANSPLTIRFDDPVTRVGAFLGMGVEGAVHTLQVSVFGEDHLLIGSRTVQSWLWDSTSKKQNYETFFAVDVGSSLIGSVEILNLAHTNYANGLILDDLAWNVGAAGSAAMSIPEPTTLMLLTGGLICWSRPRRRL